tara:strand:- start:34683 stop:35153 length:471 start_codon:yes stop_codon:yes gene_type:complete
MNIGFYILDIDPQNQHQATLLNSINELCKARPYDNIVLFNNKFNTIDLDHKYYILHISEAKFFKGVLFVFDIRSALLTKTFPAPQKQILHIRDNTWSEKKDIPYRFWESIYMNDKFELIADSKDMFELCDTCWRTPIATVQHFQPKDIENVIQKLQ